MNDTDFKNATKVFLNAYASAPQQPVLDIFTKAQIRVFRAQIIDQCENQQNTNPVVNKILQQIASVPLVELGKIMLSMKKLHDQYELEYQKIRRGETKG